MAQKTVLVTGASGLVGMGVLKAFSTDKDTKVIAVSRRKPFDTYGAEWISADLTDGAACDKLFGAMSGVTHLVFAALFEKPGLVAGWLEEDQIDTNDRMLRNTFEPLRKVAKGLTQVVLLQGTKAYGAHVHPIVTPARANRDEDKTIPNFYWRQQGYLEGLEKDADWDLTIMRPQIIFGVAVGAAMNPISALGVYGALLKAKGEPLYYPGGPVDLVWEGVDADMLGRCIRWTTEAKVARGKAYNFTNGDVYVWRSCWPAIAAALGMEPGPERKILLGETMPERGAEWDALRRKHDLVAPDINAFVGQSFAYVDLLMAHGLEERRGLPTILSTVELRQDGFTEVIDTEAMFAKFFRQFQDRKLLPPA